MTSADIHALTGAYALDAVSGVERMDFERHLAECDSCTQEVRELRETAARLGLAAAAPPPPMLKSRVMAEIHNVRQQSPETTVVPLRRRSLAQRLTLVAAAVFFVATAGLGVIVVRQNSQLDDATAQATRMEQILSAGDAQLLTMQNRDGGTMRVAVSRSQDKMLLLSDDLASPPEGKTYQVWAVDAGGQRSMGLMKPSNGDVSLAVGGFSGANTVAVTVEPDGGSQKPTLEEKVMSADIPVS